MCCLVPRVSLGENLKGAQWVHLLSQSYSVNYGGEGDGKELSWDSKCEMKIYTITSSIWQQEPKKTINTKRQNPCLSLSQQESFLETGPEARLPQGTAKGRRSLEQGEKGEQHTTDGKKDLSLGVWHSSGGQWRKVGQACQNTRSWGHLFQASSSSHSPPYHHLPRHCWKENSQRNDFQDFHVTCGHSEHRTDLRGPEKLSTLLPAPSILHHCWNPAQVNALLWVKYEITQRILRNWPCRAPPVRIQKPAWMGLERGQYIQWNKPIIWSYSHVEDFCCCFVLNSDRG